MPTRRSRKRPVPSWPVETGPGDNHGTFDISAEVLSPEAVEGSSAVAEDPRGVEFLIQCFRAYVDANPQRFTVQVKDVGGKHIHFVTLANGKQN